MDKKAVLESIQLKYASMFENVFGDAFNAVKSAVAGESEEDVRQQFDELIQKATSGDEKADTLVTDLGRLAGVATRTPQEDTMASVVEGITSACNNADLSLTVGLTYILFKLSRDVHGVNSKQVAQYIASNLKGADAKIALKIATEKANA